MSGNSLSMDLVSLTSTTANNMTALRRISASLESMEDTIRNEGMSRDIALLIEQQSPGAITDNARVNAFTQYPSQVKRDVGLEAINFVRGKSLKGIVIAILSAAIAAAAAFLTFLIRRFTGKEARSRKERAREKPMNPQTTADAGHSRPEWRQDPEFTAACDAFAATINMTLVNTGSGQFRAFTRDVFMVKPQGLFGALSSHIVEAIKLVRTTTDNLGGIPRPIKYSADQDEVTLIMRNLFGELQTQYNVLEHVRPNGIPGKGPLSERLMEMRSMLEADINRMAITQEPTLADIYSYRGVIDESMKMLEDMRVDLLMKEMKENSDFMQRTLSTLDVKFNYISNEAADALADAMYFIQRMLEMQSDLIGIVSTLTENVLAADSAYCQLLRTQIAAMQRAGIRFNGNEPEFAEDRKFYKDAMRFLE